MIVTPIDDETLEKMKACTRVEFPICLNEAMIKMFGENGKKSLDRIVMNDTFENTEIRSPKDIWNLYQKYMERVSNLLGDDVAALFTHQTLKEMESMFCTKCPLYENELRKRKARGLR